MQDHDHRHDSQEHIDEPRGPAGPIKAMRPPLMLAAFCLTGILIAAIFVWSPWDDGDGSGGQGGSDDPPRQEQIAQPTPPQAGTPNP
jgi:hypothetical protein